MTKTRRAAFILGLSLAIIGMVGALGGFMPGEGLTPYVPLFYGLMWAGPVVMWLAVGTGDELREKCTETKEGT